MADRSKIPRLVEERVVGRGFTKQVHRRWEPVDDSAEAFIAWFDEAVPGPPAFATLCEGWERWAKAQLRAAGLPDQRHVYYPDSDPAQWTCTKPDAPMGLWYASHIDHYILHVRNIEHDDKRNVGFAAQIIATIWRIEVGKQQLAKAKNGAPKIESLLSAAFEIGRLTTEVRSYGFAAVQGKRRIKPANLAKEKALHLVRGLIRGNPNAVEADVWTSFSGLSGSRNDVFLSNVGDGVTVECESQSWSCKKSSFLKTLLRPARQAEADGRP